MKKHFANLLLVGSVLALLPSCNINDNSNKENSTMQKLVCSKYRVNVAYENGKASLSLEKEIDLNEYDIKNSQDETISASNIVGGDIIEVYTSEDNEEDIDHIEVDEASYLIISIDHQIIPGSENEVDFIAENNASIKLDKSSIQYIILNDGSYETINEWHQHNENVPLYGIYREEEVTSGPFETMNYKLTAVYEYNPRVSIDK